MNELPVPPAAFEDPRSRELARIWAANKAQHVVLDVSLWKDPANWGLMLVDFARHVANAYEAANGDELDSVLARIREGFDAEWSHPTDRSRGSMLQASAGET